MSRRPDLPAAGDPAAGLRRWRVQGISSAALALVLLVAMIATQRPAQEPGSPLAPLPPQAQPAAAAPMTATAPVRSGRAVVAPRPVTAGQPAARSRQGARRTQSRTTTARPEAISVPTAAHGPMRRSYLRDAHAEGVCPAGTQSAALGLTCRGAQVREGSGGHVVRFRVCPTTTGRLDLRFAGEGEVAMSVVDRRGRTVWTWRPERPFTEDPHVLVGDVGACWAWETAWTQVDDEGQPVADGSFSLQVDFLEVDDTETYVERFDAPA